ncbi:MAG: cation transporter [Gammaproteobacteria bacterium RIFCSPHIGHO2_12_FULL_40_19]|nr:MAG: cation transporter [Gammaproteobacteria bacterium RIFCSPHIGHO2_12_FULL_40_19]
MQKKTRWIVGSGFVLLIIIATIYFSVSGTDNKIGEERGIHGGRLLIKGNVSAEITIFERGVPPRFRIYLYKNNKPLSPEKANLQITLKRFSGELDAIHFEPIDGYLQSREEIREPHSFDVDVSLKYDDKTYTWRYATYEGRVTLSKEAIRASGIKTATASPAILEKKLSVFGKIISNREATTLIYPRYSGIIKALDKNLGDSVQKGEIIATVESNESLQKYAIHSPITGTIVKKQAAVGEMIKEDKPLYEIADLNTVWADLTLYRKDAPLIKNGMKVIVTGDEGKPRTESTITYVSPLGIEDSQTVLARAILPNQNREWLPGMYINATINISEKNVPIAVTLAALQQIRHSEAVFINNGDTFEATPVTVGEKNGHFAEIISGLKQGQSYVSENSFILKADLNKSDAEHDHG